MCGIYVTYSVRNTFRHINYSSLITLRSYCIFVFFFQNPLFSLFFREILILGCFSSSFSVDYNDLVWFPSKEVWTLPLLDSTQIIWISLQSQTLSYVHVLTNCVMYQYQWSKTLLGGCMPLAMYSDIHGQTKMNKIQTQRKFKWQVCSQILQVSKVESEVLFHHHFTGTPSFLIVKRLSPDVPRLLVNLCSW